MQQEEKKLSLDEIHAELLEQLRDITAVCKKHNISYNMMCGSLLGAVRHKGFIPWDDDVDLLMTREEFQKFREIYPKECDKRFELTYLDTWTPRVMNRDPEKAAAFTDFFILDPVPPEGFQRKWWFFKLHTLQGMLKKNVDSDFRHACAGSAVLSEDENALVRAGFAAGEDGQRPVHVQRCV